MYLRTVRREQKRLFEESEGLGRLVESADATRERAGTPPSPTRLAGALLRGRAAALDGALGTLGTIAAANASTAVSLVISNSSGGTR